MTRYTQEQIDDATGAAIASHITATVASIALMQSGGLRLLRRSSPTPPQLTAADVAAIEAAQAKRQRRAQKRRGQKS